MKLSDLVKTDKSDLEIVKEKILKKKAQGVLLPKSLPPKSASKNDIAGGNGGQGEKVGLSITETKMSKLSASDPNHPLSLVYSQIEHVKSMLKEITAKVPIKAQLGLSRDIMDIHKTMGGLIKIWGDLATKYESKDDVNKDYLEAVKMQSTILIDFVMQWDCECCANIFKRDLKDVLGDMGTDTVRIQSITET